MLKLIIAAMAALMIATAPAAAIDAPIDNQAIVTPFIYNDICEPISDKLMDKVHFFGKMMTEQEAMRALYAVNVEVDQMGKVNWCATLKPIIEKLQ